MVNKKIAVVAIVILILAVIGGAYLVYGNGHENKNQSTNSSQCTGCEATNASVCTSNATNTASNTTNSTKNSSTCCV